MTSINNRYSESINNIQSDSVKKLYDVLYSHEVSQLKTVHEIKNWLTPYINNIINDNNAYNEAITINVFKTLKTHLEEGIKEFELLDFEASMAASIFFYAYK